MKKAEWYFDFISPFAYLQLARFEQLRAHLDIRPVPVVFGGLLKHWGQLGPAEIPAKRRFVYRLFQWQAQQLGVPFVMPERHPFNPLPALRLCVAAGSEIDHAQAIFDLIYGQGVQPDDPAGIRAMAAAVQLDDPEQPLSDGDVKQRLLDNGAAAIAAGVFGVPTFVVDGQLFWGSDATDMLLDYLNHPELFETTEMQRISQMPMGTVRKR